MIEDQIQRGQWRVGAEVLFPYKEDGGQKVITRWAKQE
jgi:hypothetical protein